jgi:hypothetical protein
MNRKTVLLLAAGLILVSSAASAQGGFQFTQQEHKLEIIPMYGYAWTWSKDAYYGAYSGQMDIKSSGFWGIAGDINVRPGMQLRLLYRRQDSQLTWKYQGSTEDLTDIGVEYWQIGGVTGMQNGKVMPFTGLTLGTTRYIIDGLDDEYKFSIILSLGAKVYINERIGLMVSGQMPFTFTDAFLGIGTGGMSFGGTGIVQMDVVGGLIIML